MDEDAGRMRLVLAAESKARREEEQLELAEKNAEMYGTKHPPLYRLYAKLLCMQWQWLHCSSISLRAFPLACRPLPYSTTLVSNPCEATTLR